MRLLAILLLLCGSALAQTYTLTPPTRQCFIGTSGNYIGKPLSGGQVQTYAAGTTTPQTTYRDSIGTANTNPVILDAVGCASIWLNSSLFYKFVVLDSFGASQYTQDNVSSASASSVSANFASPPALGNAAPNAVYATNVTANTLSVNGVINVKAPPYNATGNGSTDDTTAIQTAINTASSGGSIYFPIGVYKISSALNLCSVNHVTLSGEGSPFSTTGTSGANQTKIVQVTANVPVINACTATGWTVQHLWLAHSPATTTSGGDGIAACLTQTCDRPQIIDVYVSGNYNGLNLGPTISGNLLNIFSSNNSSDGIAMTGQSFSNALQWAVINVNSQLNDGHGFNVVSSSAAAVGTNIGSWYQPYTYANTAGGIRILGNSTRAISDLTIVGCVGSSDGNDEIKIDSYGTNISVVGCVLEGAGTGFTGSTGSTPASGVGNGVTVTANNQSIVISSNVIQTMSQSAVLDAGTYTAVTGNRISSSHVGYQNTTGSTTSSVVGNSINNNTTYGVFLNVAKQVSFAGNTYAGNTTSNFNGASAATLDESLSQQTTVASLPTCNGTSEGSTKFVTDGTASLAWGATVTGGSSTNYKVVCDGSNWTVMGK